MANRAAWRQAAWAVTLAACTEMPTAQADSVAYVTPTVTAVLARPIGGTFGGAHVGRGPAGGVLLGVDGAWATTLASGDDPAQGAAAFGLRAGWMFPNGLGVHARYDDLGVEPASSHSPLQLATLGLRYSLPFFVPMPFAEVNAGAAFAPGDARFGAGAGLGVSVPLGPYVLLDVAGHDWLVPIADALRQTLTAGVALAILLPPPGVP